VIKFYSRNAVPVEMHKVKVVQKLMEAYIADFGEDQ